MTGTARRDFQETWDRAGAEALKADPPLQGLCCPNGTGASDTGSHQERRLPKGREVHHGHRHGPRAELLGFEAFGKHPQLLPAAVAHKALEETQQ